jgi:hypothetical protein
MQGILHLELVASIQTWELRNIFQGLKPWKDGVLYGTAKAVT